MRIPTRPRQHGLSFNITPLIDVVLLLIIFFLAASHLVRTESLKAVELPEAEEAGRDDDQAPRRLVVTVTEDSGLFVAGRPVTAEQVEAMILSGQRSGAQTAFEVRIRSDRRVPYHTIEPLLLACARLGVTRVGFAVLEK